MADRLGPVLDIGGGWQLSFRTIELVDWITAVPVIRPAGGDWIEMPPETLTGLSGEAHGMRKVMEESIELLNSWRSVQRHT